jgi:FkbM family methyltransferase
MLRHLIHKIILKLGYDIRRVSPLEWQPGRAYWDAKYLKRLGFNPRTIVDVGVAYGTPYLESRTLYEAFPDSYFILIEPLKEFEPYLQDILKKYKGTYFLTALGARDEHGLINIEPRYLERSSFYRRGALELSGESLSKRKISLTTLDGLLERQNFYPPFGLKMDTEGFEFQVIEGASRFLEKTEFVITEVPVANRFEGGYSFADFILLMNERGFSVCDILDIGRADNSEVIFMDLVFRRTG